MLLPQQMRVVIECDGRQHYPDESGRADTNDMRRWLPRTGSYDSAVTRSTASVAELTEGGATSRRITSFFDRLAERYST